MDGKLLVEWDFSGNNIPIYARCRSRNRSA